MIKYLNIWLLSVHAEDDYYYDDDTQKCALNESIIGGTVKYSNVGAVGSEVTYYCEDGFKPYPILKKICSSKGKWEPEISRVICEGQMATDGTTIIVILLFTFTRLFFF